MQFTVLGPVDVIHRGISYAPSAAKLRHMLALLAAHHNRPVTLAAVLEEVWGATPPRSGAAAVHTHMTQLRKTLRDPAAGDDDPSARIVTVGATYVLRCERDEIDMAAFGARADAARATAADGDREAASQMLRSALDLWRGAAFADITPGPALAGLATTLDERRLAVLAERIDIDLRLGRHHELVAETAALVNLHPEHEVFTAQLMTALCRSWRRAEALEAFHRLRAHRARRGRREPSPRLHRLYRSILKAEPDDREVAETWSRQSLDLVDTDGRVPACD